MSRPRLVARGQAGCFQAAHRAPQRLPSRQIRGIRPGRQRNNQSTPVELPRSPAPRLWPRRAAVGKRLSSSVREYLLPAAIWMFGGPINWFAARDTLVEQHRHPRDTSIE